MGPGYAARFGHRYCRLDAVGEPNILCSRVPAMWFVYIVSLWSDLTSAQAL